MTTFESTDANSVLAVISSDDTLLARVACGDERAMAALYDRHSRLAYSVALRVCQESAGAEQVTQSLFLELWLGANDLSQQPGSLSGKLAVRARNLAVGLLRGSNDAEHSYVGQEGTRGAFPPSPDPIRHTEVPRLMHKPHALVLLLPDLDRQVLEMAFFDGKTTAEIAAETGLPRETLAKKVCSALDRQRHGAVPSTDDTGLEVLDLDTNAEFLSRRLHTRNIAMQMEGLRRLTRSFVDNPESILQELVNAAVDLCGADSAGISLETAAKSDKEYYHWVATAGQYNGFMNAVLPRYPSACGICLERGKPQLFRVSQRFFDIMGIQAPLVTDGILLPWQVDDTRGTIFIMAHGRTSAFDQDDGQLMRVLADFAALAIRHQKHQKALLEHERAVAAGAMANHLAHLINNPLQGLMNTAYLAAEGHGDPSAQSLGRELSGNLQRLSVIVSESLSQLDGISE